MKFFIKRMIQKYEMIICYLCIIGLFHIKTIILRSELCATEAKTVLTRASLLAGDYDCQLSGVYGDVDSSGDKESDLIPLLKQLIALLESGGPFTLSSELLNLISQGTEGGAGQHVTNINIGGSGGAGDIKRTGSTDSLRRRRDQKVRRNH